MFAVKLLLCTTLNHTFFFFLNIPYLQTGTVSEGFCITEASRRRINVGVIVLHSTSQQTCQNKIHVFPSGRVVRDSTRENTLWDAAHLSQVKKQNRN